MSFEVRIHEPGGKSHRAEIHLEEFWVGAGEGRWEVALAIPKLWGELFHVRRSGAGVEVRAEPELPTPVMSSGAALGTRYEPLLEGEVLTIAGHRVEILLQQAQEELPVLGEVDALGDGDAEGLGDWFEQVVELADRLEAVRDVDELARTTMTGVLATTRADRVHVAIEVEGGRLGEWFHSRVGGDKAFGVSQSLIEHVRRQRGIVFVPESSKDPEVAGLLSIRTHGIRASLAVPLRALGRSVGVLYADCIEPGRQLAPSDFQKAALFGRMLAGAIGGRRLLESFLESSGDAQPVGLRSRSPACRDMIEKARLFAPTDYTILIRGETGAGKDVLARALHEISGRSAGVFVAVNCAAIPGQLMESELFGHVKGSFTGATANKQGFFVAADGGTLFLDEIGDMELDLQAKILRVLETREITPVGGTQPQSVDVRILAATHQDLEQMVQDGTFREDLYFRIRELELRIPPLRERVEDILELAEHFLLEAADEVPGLRGRPGLTPEATRLLLEHPWRGNIRELRHAMRTALLRAGSALLGPEHLELGAGFVGRTDSSSEAERRSGLPGLAPAFGASSSGGEGMSYRDRPADEEKRALAESLARANGNVSEGARIFGLARTTYREKLVRYGLI
jgi:Nif-specific regulatory protein